MLRVAAVAAAVAVLLSRLAHLRLVWIEEAYGMAAARELLRGRELYSQVWFDKPPLYALFYTLSGGQDGWPLRVAGAALVLLSALCVGLAAGALWGRREALLAGIFACFSLTFWTHSAVIAVAPDLLMIAPHALAVFFAVRGKPWMAGTAAGVCLLANSKGLFVLPLVLLWCWRSAAPVLLSFSAVQLLAFAWLPAGDYWRQVWWWGFRYSADTFLTNPVAEGLRRTAGWAGFHATLVIGSALFLLRSRNPKLFLWLVLSAVSVVAGLRFFPRYYFALLPVMAVCAARGILLLGPRSRVAVLSLLLIPLVRFGPRYYLVAAQGSDNWSDAALMRDSRAAGEMLKMLSGGSGDLLVWGYRPDVYVFSGLPAAGKWLDSQPLTGVLADRHLVRSEATFPDLARAERSRLAKTRPEFIVDGLGPLNPALKPQSFPELRGWMDGYTVAGRTGASVIYRRIPKEN